MDVLIYSGTALVLKIRLELFIGVVTAESLNFFLFQVIYESGRF